LAISLSGRHRSFSPWVPLSNGSPFLGELSLMGSAIFFSPPLCHEEVVGPSQLPFSRPSPTVPKPPIPRPHATPYFFLTPVLSHRVCHSSAPLFSLTPLRHMRRKNAALFFLLIHRLQSFEFFSLPDFALHFFGHFFPSGHDESPAVPLA